MNMRHLVESERKEILKKKEKEVKGVHSGEKFQYGETEHKNQLKGLTVAKIGLF